MENTTQQLSVYDRSIAIAGVEFGSNKLTIDHDLTKDELIEILSFVAKSESASMFWVGDILNYISKTYGEDTAKQAAANFSDPQLAMEAMLIAAETPERFKLSWQHYRAARQECGNNRDASQWLQVAEVENWPVSVMRKAIRRQMAEQGKGDEGERIERSTTGTKTITGEVSRFTSFVTEYVSDRPLDQWTPKALEAFLEDTAALRSVIYKAQKLWAKIQPELV